MTDRLGNTKNTLDAKRLQELKTYVKRSTFEAVIVDFNQDLLLKEMNKYVLDQKNTVKGISLSFKNQTELIQ